MSPDISIICPVFNEEAFLPSLLDFLVEVKPANKEIILVDGGSTDGSMKIMLDYAKRYGEIKILNNPDRIVPFALNLAIKESRAPIISRIDAHCDYANDYFEKILETFMNCDADVVGGPTRTAFKNSFQEAVGIAISSRMGVGGSKVHQENYRGYLDSVTFGAWKKTLFDEVGYFDKRLKRNQDDEFHYRAGEAGKKIYQNPEIQLYYYPRSNLKALFKQYFQYGLYKPMVLNKIKSGRQLRHYIPSLFVCYLAILIATFIITHSTAPIDKSPFIIHHLSLFIAIPAICYIILCFFFSLFSKASLKAKFLLPMIYPTLHLAYGLGFISGLFKLKTLQKS